jgi:hypothetical protein
LYHIKDIFQYTYQLWRYRAVKKVKWLNLFGPFCIQTLYRENTFAENGYSGYGKGKVTAVPKHHAVKS